MPVYSRDDPLPLPPKPGMSMLPYGNGRSYGDSCLNDGGAALMVRPLDRFIGFNPQSGVLTCESGVLLSEILELMVPRGWFLPVVPGTRFVTVGGAIANDVHGKNHHQAGTFGCHVLRLELLRSDGRRMRCSREDNPLLFSATLGGLGLTGLVTWAEIQLRRIDNPWIDLETLRFGSLREFFQLCTESDGRFEYTVAWLDCAGRGRAFGRGLFMRGNHAGPGASGGPRPARARAMPFTPPWSLVNPLSLQAFNLAYYHRPIGGRRTQHYEPFFFPLDGIGNWNRIYGPRGFRQYQCVLPAKADAPALERLLREISGSRGGSFLSVLKVFGTRASPGMLSFPMAGASLALDFPEQGAGLEQLFGRMDTIVREAGGRLYPAKDSRMGPGMFRAGFDRWQEFSEHIDPRFSSSFWRRVTEQGRKT
jgi:FAD/FMN-containing dehydrogenase